ncbi:hypothetical protein HYQ46_004673 [Verticillium longisporum]|nr:hypothetical protein HYQ46_004673 [Verticillium longisporum]
MTQVAGNENGPDRIPILQWYGWLGILGGGDGGCGLDRELLVVARVQNSCSPTKRGVTSCKIIVGRGFRVFLLDGGLLRRGGHPRPLVVFTVDERFELFETPEDLVRLALS